MQETLRRRLLVVNPPSSLTPHLLLPAHVLPPQPLGGWKCFYSAFELEWPAWLCAGCNTEERCLVGIHGSVYDLTAFLPQHPGSKETILINAGGDATAFYEDVGHSANARSMMAAFVALSPPPAEGDGARGIPARCVLERVKEELAAARRRVEGGEGRVSPILGLQSALGGGVVSMGAFRFSEQAAAVLLGGPVAAGTEDEDEEEEDGEGEEEGLDGYGMEEEEGDSPSLASTPPPAGLYGGWKKAGGSLFPTATPSPPSSSHSSPTRPLPRCGCSPPCTAASRHFLPPLPPNAAAAAFCPPGAHTGAKRAVLDLVTGGWVSWRGCCGRLLCERRQAAAAGVEGGGRDVLM